MSEQRKPMSCLAAVVVLVAMLSAVALPIWWLATVTLSALGIWYDGTLLLVPAYAVAVAVIWEAV